MVQRNKIKVLNQTIRRQKNKLSSLEALLKHLKSTNLLTEAAHDSILVLIIYEDCCVYIYVYSTCHGLSVRDFKCYNNMVLCF